MESMDLPADAAAEHEALLQFLYLAPVGIVQTTADGAICMINPLSAQLLMPLASDGNLANLFDALDPVAPELRSMAASFAGPSGAICDGHRVQLTAGIPGGEDPRFLSVSLVKLDAERFMAVLSDITLVMRRERQLRQSEAWFNAILTGPSGPHPLGTDNFGRDVLTRVLFGLRVSMAAAIGSVAVALLVGGVPSGSTGAYQACGSSPTPRAVSSASSSAMCPGLTPGSWASIAATPRRRWISGSGVSLESLSFLLSATGMRRRGSLGLSVTAGVRSCQKSGAGSPGSQRSTRRTARATTSGPSIGS